MAAETHTLYIYAICVGIAVAGFVGSAWALATGERPQFKDILEPDLLTPFKVPALILHAPVMVLYEACVWLILKPIIGVALLVAGLGWSFLQGVFILTHIFGLN